MKPKRCFFRACHAPLVYAVVQKWGTPNVVHCCEAHRPGNRTGAPSGVAYHTQWYDVTPITDHDSHAGA